MLDRAIVFVSALAFIVAPLVAVTLLLGAELWRTRPRANVLPVERHFDLATFFGAVTAIGIACAAYQFIGWPLALLGGFITSCLIQLFATEVLAGTKYGADRSRTREYRLPKDDLVVVPPACEPATSRRRRIRLMWPRLDVTSGWITYRR